MIVGAGAESVAGYYRPLLRFIITHRYYFCVYKFCIIYPYYIKNRIISILFISSDVIGGQKQTPACFIRLKKKNRLFNLIIS